MDVQQLWQRLEIWARTHAPKMLDGLQGPASPADIAALEEKLGLELPESFKMSLQIHNGEVDNWPRVFADYGAYLSVEQIYENWTQRLAIVREISGLNDELTPAAIAEGIGQVVGPVRPVGFLPEWIPCMDWNGDVFWALDFAPLAGGTRGQLIEVDWEGVFWRVVAPSFQDFLSMYVEALEGGAYTIDKEGLPTRRDSAIP